MNVKDLKFNKPLFPVFYKMKLSNTLCAVWLFCAARMPLYSFGADYYVSIEGIDINNHDGSKTKPWATINYALTQIQNGDTIKIEPGIYNISQQITITGKTGITITAVDPQNKPTIVRNSEGLIRIGSDATDTTISYLMIQYSSRRTSYWYGNVYVLANGANIHHCEITKGFNGIEIADGHSHEIAYNEIHDFGTIGRTPETGNGMGIIQNSTAPSNWNEKIYIHHNNVYDNGGDSYQCQSSPGNRWHHYYVELAHNNFHHNGEDAIDIKDGHYFKVYNNLLHDNAANGIVTHSNLPAHDFEFYNNTIYNNGWWGIGLMDGARWNIFNNIVYNNAFDQDCIDGNYTPIGVNASGSDIYVVHNVIYNNGPKAGYLGSAVFQNNIVMNNGQSGYFDCKGNPSWGNMHITSSGTISHNYVFPTSPGITGTSTITSNDPGLTDISNYNFTLSKDSPLKDTGTSLGLGSSFSCDFNGVSRPQDSGWDIGAYEYSEKLHSSNPSAPRNLQVLH